MHVTRLFRASIEHTRCQVFRRSEHFNERYIASELSFCFNSNQDSVSGNSQPLKTQCKRQSRNAYFRILGIVFGFLILSVNLQATISVTLSSSTSFPMPLGTVIEWTANASDTSSGTLWYRFSAGKARPFLSKSREELKTAFHVIVDFGPNNSLRWNERPRFQRMHG